MRDDRAENYRVVIVTGFGRCGSSLVMQMLETGGIPCTGEYPAFEHELGSVILSGEALTTEMLAPFAGHAVKLLDPHRGSLPVGPEYRVIWMSRDHAQQGKSQAKFISVLTGMPLGRDMARDFARSYGPDTPKLQAALDRAGVTSALRLTFEGVLSRPHAAATVIAAHVGIDPSKCAGMAAVVRNRDPACAPDLSMELTLIDERRQAIATGGVRG